MKYLIDENSKVTMKGTTITAIETAGEVLYTPHKDAYAMASMKEIAQANGFKLQGKNQSELKASFDSALSKLKLAKVTTMSVSDEIKTIVQDGVDNDKSESEILISIVNSGVKFNQAIKHFKNAKIELGLSISNEDREKKSTALMEDEGFEPETYDDVTVMVKTISKDVPNTNEQQALIQIRKFCKANKIDLPKKPKGSSVPFAVKAMAWIVANIEAEADDFEEFLEDNNRGEKVVESWTKKFAQVQAEVKANAPTTAKTPIKAAKKGGKKAA